MSEQKTPYDVSIVRNANKDRPGTLRDLDLLQTGYRRCLADLAAGIEVLDLKWVTAVLEHTLIPSLNVLMKGEQSNG